MSLWQDFLLSRGGRWTSDHGLTFAGQSDPGPDAPQLSVLSHQRLLAVSGPDTAKFLQGQLTCDVGELQQGLTRLGAHCNHKGRMIADFRIAALGADNCALRLHHSTRAPLQQSLGKYIVFSKAELRQDDDTCLIGLAGARAAEVLGAVFGDLPTAPDGVALCREGAVIYLGDDRFECWLEADAAIAVLTPLLARCRIRDTDYWDLLDIRAGVGQVRAAAAEAFIPQLLNYHLIGGVSFTKGCYTGQEVVARMQYRGKLKRHMYRMGTVADIDAPPPGSEIFAEGSGQSVGNLVLSAPAENSGLELLGVCTSAAADAGSVFLDREKQLPLKVLPLPYAITNNGVG